MNLEGYKPEVLKKASEILKGLANDLTEDSEGAVLVYHILKEAQKEVEKNIPNPYAGTLHPEVLNIVLGHSSIASSYPDKKVWKAVQETCCFGLHDEKFSSQESKVAFQEQVDHIVNLWNKPKSVGLLDEHLKALGFNVTVGKGNCEAYGRNVQAYVRFADNAERKRAESLLKKLGWKVNEGYSQGSGTAEIQVSYFKARNWNI